MRHDGLGFVLDRGCLLLFEGNGEREGWGEVGRVQLVRIYIYIYIFTPFKQREEEGRENIFPLYIFQPNYPCFGKYSL